MLTEQANGLVDLNLRDWTREMLVLSLKLYRLPRRPGAKGGPTGLSTHDAGIDLVAQEPWGELAINLMLTHVSNGELEYCPDCVGVVRLAHVLMAAPAQVELALRRARHGQQKSARRIVMRRGN
jgi:hypothetical protein